MFLSYSKNKYRVRRCLVSCKFGKILVVGNFIKQNFSIRNYFKKDLLNFSFD